MIICFVIGFLEVCQGREIGTGPSILDSSRCDVLFSFLCNIVYPVSRGAAGSRLNMKYDILSSGDTALWVLFLMHRFLSTLESPVQ